ncbi:MAG: dihydrofolate reductase [Xanthobacteraceae bacterium]
MRRIEGYVIVSADGMIADGKGEMPPSIRNDADQRFFQDALDHAAVVVHGRHSHEGGPRAARRRRLILTRRVAALAPDSAYPNAWLWNPVGANLDAALDRLGIGDGTVAVIGGTEVFSLFLPLYDAFHLSQAANAKIPGGLPVFSEVGPNATPEDVLARHGLKPRPRRDLDRATGVSVMTWER